jgi:hypothetical protein
MQVVWLGVEDCYTSWEKEENVPCSIIDEFNSQMEVLVEEESQQQNGHTCCILRVGKRNEKVVQPNKKVKKCDRIVIGENSG